MLNIAVIGAGGLAAKRAQALINTGQARICAVATRHIETAQAFAGLYGCEHYFNDYRAIEKARPDAVLIETPHDVIDEIAPWCIEHDLHTLIGAPLASNLPAAERITKMAAEKPALVIEAGFEARYSAIWSRVKAMVEDQALGAVNLIQCIALFDCQESRWEYNQAQSGGMPVCHMSYCYINPIRWLFGEPLTVSAFANQIRNRAPQAVTEETCIASLLLPGSILCSMTAGYVNSWEKRFWSVFISGTRGALEFDPLAGDLLHHQPHGSSVLLRADNDQDFLSQAEAFCRSIMEGDNICRNTPAQTIGDIRICDLIARSAKEHVVLALEG